MTKRELTTGEWIAIRDEFAPVRELPFILGRIVNYRFGRTHKINSIMNKLHQTVHTFKDKFDQIICNAYPLEIECLPNSDIPIHALFYQYTDHTDVPDLVKETPLPKTFTKKQKTLIENHIRTCKDNLNKIMIVFTEDLKPLAPYYNYRTTVKKLNTTKNDWDIQIAKLEQLLLD